MVKNIEYYMGLPYTREIIPDPEGGYVIAIKELPGCFSQGETLKETWEMGNDAMRGWLEVAIEDNQDIPEPKIGLE